MRYAKGSGRVNRGGSWHYYGYYSRVSFPNYSTPASRGNDLGFRLVRKY